ncbi:hypothetical protein MLD38_028459 [Melastoma candidum]|uniref:Uncharacterized protein n=1 Tax=Melastoma candidum TaxID=119954 RepID=A0ACB9N1N6_9MYRT|nr:hypothetical protein MLD38_028459 [Melastoma candidum]
MDEETTRVDLQLQALDPFPGESYAYLLQSSQRAGDASAGRPIHARVVKSGSHHLGLFLMNSLVSFYAKTGSPGDARKLFDEMPVRNVLSWNTVLSMYSKLGIVDEAFRIFERMPERDSVSWTAMIVGFHRSGSYAKSLRMFVSMLGTGVSPTQYNLTSVLASCAAVSALGVGKRIHSFVVKLGFSGCSSVANSLVNMYEKSGDGVTAGIVFYRIRSRNVSCWNTMISLHMSRGDVELARMEFERMRERDVVSWNSMIAGYNQHRHDVEALHMLSRMLGDHALKPDKFSMTSALSACANIGNLRIGREIHGYLAKTGFDGTVRNALISLYAKSGKMEIARKVLEENVSSENDIVAFTAILDGYVKLGDMSPARQIFDSLTYRDVVAWTAMIVGYVQNGLNNDALKLFMAMIKEGVRPNSYTLAIILAVTADLASLIHGKQIHASALRTGEAFSASVGNALINLYSKAGSINAARKVFEKMHKGRDTISWTSIILALAQHGLGEDALELFEKMLALKIKPDHITYVGILSACTHIGLVEQGRKYYKMMQEVHNIEPTSSHYACMVDLYGRSGLLQEAWDFIKDMPVEPDVVAWGSLLSSCRVHKDVELAELAAEKLLLLDPHNGGAYSALANLYLAAGKWDEAAKIRKHMKEKGVKKEQGSSWVQIQDTVHIFGAEDCLHPQKEAIYKKMDELWKEIKKMGFVPNTQSVVHDLEDEVKEQCLKHHSEKLALAFALINTPENTTLRIMKNLRVCNDCHSAFKYISKLVVRDIILRDCTRFHHFKDGSCSCRDYW